MASTSLIVPTRFSPPRLPFPAVPRARLLIQLAAASGRKLVLVTAGAGFGKTTLMAQWGRALAQDQCDVAWLTLGRSEASFSTLFADVVESLQRAGVELSRCGHAGLYSNENSGAGEWIGLLVNDLAEHPRNLCLILDDAQNLSDPVAVSALRELIEQSTDNVRIALVGRSIPPIPLSRLRVSAQTAELGPDDLAFDETESDQFLRTRATRQLPDNHLQQAHRLAGGWPAGLQLLLFSLQQGARWDRLSDLVRSGPALRDYIVENVLSGLGPALIDFLKQIAVTPRFCVSLARAVTRVENTEEVVRELERRHLFLAKFGIDGPDTWYQFHPLFMDVLRSLTAERDPGLLACHARAAAWFADNGFLLEAVGQGKAASMAGAGFDWLDSAPMSLRSLAELGQIRRVADAIDPGTLAPRSKLISLAAWAYLLSGDLRRAMNWVDRLDASLSEEIALSRCAIEAGVALYQDDTERMRALLASIDPGSIEQPFLRQCIATEVITAEQGSGRFEAATRLQASLSHAMRNERHEMALIVRALKSATLLMQGDARTAEQSGLQTLREAEALAGAHSVSAAVSAAFLADAQYELDRIDEARATLAGRWHMLHYSPPHPRIRGVLTQARLTALAGGPIAALNLLAEVLPRFESCGSDRALALLLHEQLRLHLVTGRRESTEVSLATLQRLADRNQGAGGFLAEIGLHSALAGARVDLDAGLLENAERQLRAARQQAEALNRTREQLSVALLEARCHSLRKDAVRAQSAAARAMALARPGGLRRTVLDEGPAIAEVLLTHSDTLLIPPELLSGLGCLRESGPTPSGSRPVNGPQVPGKLTPREFEIVQLLSQSMSNKRIAAALNIAPSTVKWNLQNIYMKLGLNTRFDVIMWLRKLESR